jgi:hypothetical protein
MKTIKMVTVIQQKESEEIVIAVFGSRELYWEEIWPTHLVISQKIFDRKANWTRSKYTNTTWNQNQQHRHITTKNNKLQAYENVSKHH